jgi:transposase InsO family protein
MSSGSSETPKIDIKTKNQNPASQTTKANEMDKISQTILKSAIEAIPLLTIDNFTLWKNRVENVLDLQELTDSLTSPNGKLTKSQDVQLRTVLTAKLDSSIQANIINHTNEKDARLIWSAIMDHFASSKASNRARVFKELLRLKFNINDIPGFITDLKTTLARFHEIGIEIADDIVTYLVIDKLPTSLESVAERITQSDQKITPERAIEVLKTFDNDRNIKASGNGTKLNPISLFTDTVDTRCKKGAHNTAAPNHNEANCWKLHPETRPLQYQNPPKKDKTEATTVSNFFSSMNSHTSRFILDSGSSAHMVTSWEFFHSLELKELGVVRTSSANDTLQIQGAGTIKLKNKYGEILLRHVLFVPNMTVNLLSVRCLVLENYVVDFFKNSFEIKLSNKIKASGRYIGNLPCLEFDNIIHRSCLSSGELLHKSLGHVSFHRLRKKLGIPLKSPSQCVACAVSKVTKASFTSKHARASKPFEELHMDLIGPIWPKSNEGHRYILTIVDSCTRFCAGIPLKHKSDTPKTIAYLLNLEAKRIGYFPTVLHSDRGTEFVNNALKKFCEKNIIRLRTSDAYTPQQNGLAERFNRTILESVRSILEDSGVNRKWWHEILKASTLALNQIPSHRSNKSPFELFKNRSLSLDYFHPIGNKVSYVIQPEPSQAKLSPRGKLGILIGYNDEIGSWKILTEDEKILDTKHVNFLEYSKNKEPNETDLSIEEEDSESVLDPEDEILEVDSDDQEENLLEEVGSVISTDDEEFAETLIPTGAPTRTLREQNEKVKPIKYTHLTSDPSSYKNAIESKESSLWKAATSEELASIEHHEVWEDMRETLNSFLRTTWVFRTKPATLSCEERKKARLCIQGFSQIPGKDYDDTFAPTGKYTLLLIILMFAVDKRLPMRQFDVKAAFLYAPLKEELYIKTPEGSTRNSPFLQLKKSLYGLKQAPANWYETLTRWFVEIKFHQSSADPCLFIHNDRKSFIFFHVDDLLVVGDVDSFEELFLSRFPNSSAHPPDTLLGMDLETGDNFVSLSQRKLIDKGLTMMGMLECKPVKTPLSVGVNLQPATPNEKEEFKALGVNYRTYTGILNYLSCRTRPDLAPAVSILSSFNNDPGINHWKEIQHCWKYLQGTAHLKLTLRPNEDGSNALEYFSDATWADDLESRLSRSGTICFWKNCPLAWGSKKQKNIAMSSTEAKMNALSDSVQESPWVKFVVEELWDNSLQPTQFNVDNKGLVEKVSHFGSNSKTKHLDIKLKYIRNLKKNEEIVVKLIPSEDMVADALTKASSSESMKRLQARCFLVQFSPDCGGVLNLCEAPVKNKKTADSLSRTSTQT